MTHKAGPLALCTTYRQPYSLENLLYNFLDQSLPQQLFPASKPWAGQEVAAHEPSEISAVTNREILVFLLGLLSSNCFWEGKF